MLIPIVEIIESEESSLIKHLKFSYPLNDRSFAEALSGEFHKLDGEQLSSVYVIRDLLKAGFEAAKMTYATHTETSYTENHRTKVTGFIDVPYHYASSNAIRNLNPTLKSILSYSFSKSGLNRLSHANINQDPKSLLSEPASWFGHNFWDFKESYSSLLSNKAVIYSLPLKTGGRRIMNIHNGVGVDDTPFLVLKNHKPTYLIRELAKVYCQWFREQSYNQHIESISFDYADLYSKLPYRQVCNKNLVKSIQHYREGDYDIIHSDRYTINDFDYTNDSVRIYGWYLHGHNLSIRYMHKDQFRVDQIYLPDHFTELFNRYEFSLEDFVLSVVLPKVSKYELRKWLGENKGSLEGVEIPYFNCVYRYLVSMREYEEFDNRPIFKHDQRMLRWLKHFEFITSDLKLLPKAFTYLEVNNNAYTDSNLI